MSTFGTRHTAVGVPLALRFNGTSVTQYVGGKVSSAKTVTAVVEWKPVNEQDNRGRATVREGELMVAGTTAVAIDDAFLIEGNRAEVYALDAIQNGVQVVHVRQNIPETKGARPLRTGDI